MATRLGELSQMSRHLQLTLFRATPLKSSIESTRQVAPTIHSDQPLYNRLINSLSYSEPITRSHANWPFNNISFGIRDLDPRWIDVSGIEMAVLLTRLYAAAQPVDRRYNQNPTMTFSDAESVLVQRGPRIVTLWGREIWVEFSPKLNRINAQWYDFWNGQGVFKREVLAMRSGTTKRKLKTRWSRKGN